MKILTALFLAGFYILVLYKCMKLFFPSPRHNRCQYAGWAALLIFRCLLWIRPVLPDLTVFVFSVLSVFLLSILSFYGSLKVKTAFSVLICIVWLAVEIIISILLRMAGLSGDELRTAGSAITEISVFFFMLLGSHASRQKDAESLSVKYVGTLLFVSFTCIYLMHHLFLIAGSQKEYGSFAVFGTLLLMAVNYIIFEVYDSLAQAADIQKKNLLYEQQLELYSRQARENEAHDLKLRRMRHDMKNHLTGMYAMAKAGDWPRLTAYIRCLLMEGDDAGREDICRSGNIIIDSLINGKYRESGLDKSRFRARLQLPADLPFQPGALAIVFGNLLENAVEACRSVSEAERYINICAFYEKGALTLDIRNPYRGIRKKDRWGYLRTTKESGDHGLGLNSARRAAAAYDGDVTAYFTDSVFRVTAVMFKHGEGEDDESIVGAAGRIPRQQEAHIR